MTLKLNLYFKEVILFGSALLLGIFSANNLFKSGVVMAEPAKFELKDLFVFIILVLILFLLRKKQLVIGSVFRIFLIFIIIAGSQIVFGSFMPAPQYVFLSLALLLGYLFYRNVLVHNIAIIIGIAGITSMIGLGITPKFGVFLLVLLSFYDIIAVYKTKHMIKMAKSMMQSGAIFGFVVPSSYKGFVSRKEHAQAKIGSDFMILGSGDIGLPLIMACSLVPVSLSGAIITALFSLIGLLFTHLIFVNQKERKPMAALPPIATMTIIGYLVTLL